MFPLVVKPGAVEVMLCQMISLMPKQTNMKVNVHVWERKKEV